MSMVAPLVASRTCQHVRSAIAIRLGPPMAVDGRQVTTGTAGLKRRGKIRWGWCWCCLPRTDRCNLGRENSQSSRISRNVVAEDDASHAGLPRSALPHEEDLLLLWFLDLVPEVAGPHGRGWCRRFHVCHLCPSFCSQAALIARKIPPSNRSCFIFPFSRVCWRGS